VDLPSHKECDSNQWDMPWIGGQRGIITDLEVLLRVAGVAPFPE
jgi:hypothetical protein